MKDDESKSKAARRAIDALANSGKWGLMQDAAVVLLACVTVVLGALTAGIALAAFFAPLVYLWHWVGG